MIRWLGQLPAEVLFPLAAVFGVAVTLGFDVLMRRYVAPETRERATATAAVTLQVTATIYAILIAFVIVDEYSQLRAAQDQIATKAAALSVVYENSRALPDPGAHELRVATLTYARRVVDVGLPHLSHRATPDATTEQALRATFATLRRIQPHNDGQRAAYDAVLRSLDQVVTTRAQVVSSARSTIPAALFWMLVVIGLVVMSVATLLDTRHRASHLYMLSALALVIWLTLALVVSMDYPFGGVIRVSDGPIREFIAFRAAR